MKKIFFKIELLRLKPKHAHTSPRTRGHFHALSPAGLRTNESRKMLISVSSCSAGRGSEWRGQHYLCTQSSHKGDCCQQGQRTRRSSLLLQNIITSKHGSGHNHVTLRSFGSGIRNGHITTTGNVFLLVFTFKHGFLFQAKAILGSRKYLKPKPCPFWGPAI